MPSYTIHITGSVIKTGFRNDRMEVAEIPDREFISFEVEDDTVNDPVTSGDLLQNNNLTSLIH